MRVVDMRLDIWRQILRLEQRREELLAGPTTRDMRFEAVRQANELKRVPHPSKLRESQESLEKKRANRVPPADDEAVNAYRSRKEQPDWCLLYYTMLDIGIAQNRLLQSRASLDETLMAAAEPLLREEPLVTACREFDVPVDHVVAWTFYALGVDTRAEEYASKVAEHTAARQEAEEEHLARKRAESGLMDKLRGKDKSMADFEHEDLDPVVEGRHEATRRERQTLDAMLSELYWDCYEDVALAYVADRMDEQAQVHVRAYLRYGMVSAHAALLQREKVESILKDCTEDVYVWEDSPRATHVVYADEYIRGIHDLKTTASPDEELELNQRGSELWKADRVWRMAVMGRLKKSLYESKRGEVEKRIEKLQREVEKIEKKVESIRTIGGLKAQVKLLNQRLADYRPHLARLQQMVETLDEKVIPRAEKLLQEGEAKLDEAEEALPPAAVARREAKFIRRLARLAARLKTPYPHFTLREKFHPGRDDHHDRASVRKAMSRVEYAHRGLFHEVLVPNKRASRQLTVRLSPAMVIVPSLGQMSLSLTPRKSTEPGKLMLPLLGQRRGMLSTLVMNAMSDFCWDCSMEEAGADWITADALCSAYANVRWQYRSRSPQAQKKAGFDKKHKDRQDWRGHYAMYVQSAKDGGRLLFNKCYEVYEVVVKHLGLPPKVERLRRD